MKKKERRWFIKFCQHVVMYFVWNNLGLFYVKPLYYCYLALLVFSLQSQRWINLNKETMTVTVSVLPRGFPARRAQWLYPLTDRRLRTPVEWRQWWEHWCSHTGDKIITKKVLKTLCFYIKVSEYFSLWRCFYKMHQFSINLIQIKSF